MRPPKTLLKFILSPVPGSILLGIIYLALALLLPPSPMTMKAYNLTPSEYHVLLFAVLLPFVLIWVAAFAGYDKLREYTHLIALSEQGSYLKDLTRGAGWLAWSLPIPAFITLIANAITYRQPSFRPASLIITTYATLLMFLVAFILIGKATRRLVSHMQLQFSLADARLILSLFIVAGIAYCYITFSRIDGTSLTSTDNAYYLPVWLIALSVILPYLYVWFVGLLAAYEIVLVNKKSSGILYRQALSLLATGLVTVIGSSIVLQYLATMQPRVGYLILNTSLVLSMILQVLRGVGFILLALGAVKLKRIEEV